MLMFANFNTGPTMIVQLGERQAGFHVRKPRAYTG
jgi:hypothetical protein